MTWTKIGDEYFEQTLLDGLGDSAVLADLEAKAWCNRMLTDGRVPKALIARACTRSADPEADALALVAAGYWSDKGEHWQLDWRDQPTRSQVEQERASNKARQERSRRHNKGDHSLCSDRCWVRAGRNGVTPAVTDGVTPAVTDGVSNGLPVPSRPDPTPREGGTRTRKRQTPRDSALTRSSRGAAIVVHTQGASWTFWVTPPDADSETKARAFWDGATLPVPMPTVTFHRNGVCSWMTKGNDEGRRVEQALVQLLGVRAERTEQSK